MNEYVISNDFLEIVTGTTNTLNPLYMEASKDVGASTPKALGYIKNFITSIENLANKSKVKDDRITKSKGNIKNFSSYDDIKVSIDFLKKNLGSMTIVKNIADIFKCLETYQPQYTEGYSKNIRLVVLEYENALDLLVTGLSMAIAENIDVVQNGTTIKIQKTKSSSNGVIHKTIADMAKQLTAKQHQQYLDEVIKSKEYAKVDTDIKESVVFTEGVVADTIELIDVMLTSVGKIGHYTVNIVRAIKNSLFGIVPIIRSCLYIRYKKKADTVIALEQQCEFIKQNIEMLQNRTNIDPKEKETIIKKQQATVEAYKKKAAKLRAELMETEKQASVAIEKENTGIKNTDDDFILEKTGFKVSDSTKKSLEDKINNCDNKVKFSDLLKKMNKEDEDEENDKNDDSDSREK